MKSYVFSFVNSKSHKKLSQVSIWRKGESFPSFINLHKPVFALESSEKYVWFLKVEEDNNALGLSVGGMIFDS